MRGMKRTLRYDLGIAGVVLAAAFCMIVAPPLAQNASAQNSPGQGGKAAVPPVVGSFDQVRALPAGGPAPRMADGHVDLTGRWYPNSAGRMLEGAYPVDRTVYRQFDPNLTEERLSFKPGMEAKYKTPFPYGICDQAGTPTTITMQQDQHAPIELIETPGRLVVLAEYPLDVRMIYTNGRAHPKDPDPTFNGDSTARWEGDTLIVDVIAIDNRLRNIDAGTPTGNPEDGGKWLHSDQEHVIERFTRSSKNYLTYQVTIEDPVALAKPWTSQPRKWSLTQSPNDEWAEVFCTHNEEPEEYKNIANETK